MQQSGILSKFLIEIIILLVTYFFLMPALTLTIAPTFYNLDKKA